MNHKAGMENYGGKNHHHEDADDRLFLYRRLTQAIPGADPREYRSLTQAIPTADPINTGH